MNDDYTYAQIAEKIDHSPLSPTLTVQDLEQGLRVALDYDAASVCIMPYYLKRCTEVLAGSAQAGLASVRASTTIGFPHGGHTATVKAAEAQRR